MLFWVSLVSSGTWFVSTFVTESMGRTATDYKYIAYTSGPGMVTKHETMIKGMVGFIVPKPKGG